MSTAAPTNNSRLMLRNAARVVVVQLLVTPLSILINALIAQKLGPAVFGELYLASAFVGFGFLFVEWGQGAVLIAEAARDRTRAGALLGTSLAFRVATAAACVGALWVLAAYTHDDPPAFRKILMLVAANSLLISLSTACQDVFRGFERIDFTSASHIAFQLFSAAVVVPLLLLGGGLVTMLEVGAGCAAIGLCVLFFALGPLGVPRLALERRALTTLLAQGTPFLGLAISLALQPNVDAFFLSRYASPEAIGWLAGARKLLSILAFPASAIISGLYPTLCRLYPSDRDEYNRTARAALVTVSLAVVPLALSCALFPDVGVRILGRAAFRPAEDDLRVFALFLGLVYFSMPLGSCMAAAGLTRRWSIAQLGCVVISAALDGPLVQYFQAHHANGGLGVCVSTVAGEVAMIVFAVVTVPKGVIDRTLARRIGLALLAGGAMALVAWALRGSSSFVAAPFAWLAYLGCLHVSGGIEREEERLAVGWLKRKLRIAR